jgi:hypothetical protein
MVMLRAHRACRVLGPTNTGKTHLAIERCSITKRHDRLPGFWREVYDRVVRRAARGPSR